jgi:hypothetical protein
MIGILIFYSLSLIGALFSVSKEKIMIILIERRSSMTKVKKPLPIGLEAIDPTLIKRIQQLERENETLRLELWRHKRKPSGAIGYGLLIFGATALILSILYSSPISAFIGLGLTFWGALLLYIKPIRYVKASLLDSTAMSNLTAINQIIADLNYNGRGIYLPPRYLKEFKGGTVYIPSENTLTIPPTEEVAQEKVFLKNPNGICLTPSGLGLANLYEKELGTDFAKADLNYLQNNLPKLFIEGLEIAEDLEINAQSDIIQVKIAGSVYQDLCKEARKLPNICHSFGCPLCSSIAIALTRATGKPITMEKNEVSPDGKNIEIHYRTLKEE